MKVLAKMISTILFIAGFAVTFSGCEQVKEYKTDANPHKPIVTGVWVVTDSAGNKFDITLNPDGTATSSWKVLDQGKWKLVDSKKVHIKWNNEANEFIILDERGRAERQTFAPGKSVEGKPDEVTKINKK